KGVLYLIALLSNLDDEQRAEALRRLAPPGATREIIQQSIAESAEILGKLPLNDPAGIYHLLSPKRVELILFSMAITKDNRKKKEISQFLVELRKTKPFLTGRDLKKLGLPEGPLYSRIFRELLDKRLKGTIRTAEDEKKYVTDHYMKG
ncbi:MAG TPA: hypothetical protein VLD55_06040, partial [Candidatus Sulfobium mesophilum]|nr:hypothetical protein [Candidatus Sulfobium mesophilum]